MISSEIIEKKLSLIPNENLEEVAMFLDFIYYKSSASQANIARKPGIMKKEIYIAEDFDAPLEDFKEYM